MLPENPAGVAKLNEALKTVAVSEPQPAEAARRRTARLDRESPTLSQLSPQHPNGHTAALGGLELLAAGTMPLDPGEFVADESLADVLSVLREWADIVLIDAPPLLTVGDATVLSARVDALIVVFRLRDTRRAALVGLARQLERCPATKLGFVTADATLGEEAWYDDPYVTSETVHGGRVTT